jgi:hypothetical protein
MKRDVHAKYFAVDSKSSERLSGSKAPVSFS